MSVLTAQRCAHNCEVKWIFTLASRHHDVILPQICTLASSEFRSDSVSYTCIHTCILWLGVAAQILTCSQANSPWYCFDIFPLLYAPRSIKIYCLMKPDQAEVNQGKRKCNRRHTTSDPSWSSTARELPPEDPHPFKGLSSTCPVSALRHVCELNPVFFTQKQRTVQNRAKTTNSHNKIVFNS